MEMEYNNLTLNQIEQRIKKKRLEQLTLSDLFLWEIIMKLKGVK